MSQASQSSASNSGPEDEGLIRVEFRRPHYMVRTPDRIHSYLEPTYSRMLVSRVEPLSKFLAPVRLEEQEGANGRKMQLAVYDLRDYSPRINLEDLGYLPDSVVAEFAEAAEAFYTGNPRIGEHEKMLRRRFRMPDPRLEPAAYWLVGPAGARRLIIIWGGEIAENSALPLSPACPDAKPGETVLDRLREFTGRWSALQREMLEIIRKTKPGIGAYIGQPVRDRKGNLTEFTVEGKRVKVEKKLPRIGRLTKSQINGFEEAFEEFYEEAFGPEAQITPYEADLRRALRLPDPVKKPEAWIMHDGHPLALVDGNEDEADVLYPVSSEVAGLPPQVDGEAVAPTVAERLAARAHPVKLYAMLGGVAAMLLVTTAVVFEIFSDHEAPQVAAIQAANDPRRIVIEFSEKVAEDTLTTNDDPSTSHVVVRDLTGKILPISDIKISESDSGVTVAEIRLGEDMLEGKEHDLLLRGVVDKSRKENPIAENFEKRFTFRDTEAPGIREVSAHPDDKRKVVLYFTEPLDKRSASSRSNYRIEGFRVDAVDLADDASSVVITATAVKGGGDQAGFIDKGLYTLEVDGVSDASSEENPIEALKLQFQYVDKVAPQLIAAVANSQTSILINFNEPVQEGMAVAVSNYTLLANGQTPLQVRKASLADGTAGRSVLLRTEPLRTGVKYSLTVQGILDVAVPPNRLEKGTLEEIYFGGPEDRSPPQITKVTVSEDLSEVFVDFNETVAEESLANAEAFELRGPETIRAYSVRGLSVDNRKIVLTLNTALVPATSYVLEVAGLKDEVGNSGNVRSQEIVSPGMGSAVYTDLRLVEVVAESANKIVVTFNAEITPQTARRAENFRLSGKFVVAGASLDPSNAEKVILNLSPETPLIAGSAIVLEARYLRIQGFESDAQDKDSMAVKLKF